MTKLDNLRRLLLPCFHPSAAPTTATTTTSAATKKRLSTSLRDDPHPHPSPQQESDQDGSAPSPRAAPSRSSKTMAIGTIFGHRRGHVWFALQHDRLKPKPFLLLELSIPTQSLVQEMQSGLVRIALECHLESDLRSCPLRCVPEWTMFCNGRKLGFAACRKPTDDVRIMLKSMQSMTVGAGVIPSSGAGELMYMRASYECVVGGPDSESFHLVTPDGCPDQELSIFLMRSR